MQRAHITALHGNLELQVGYNYRKKRKKKRITPFLPNNFYIFFLFQSLLNWVFSALCQCILRFLLFESTLFIPERKKKIIKEYISFYLVKNSLFVFVKWISFVLCACVQNNWVCWINEHRCISRIFNWNTVEKRHKNRSK